MAHLWAKSASVPRHLLIEHTEDVCRQTEQYRRLYQPVWPIEDSVNLTRVLAYSSLLHDFGKVHRDFQRALRGGGKRFENRHEVLSLAFLSWFKVPQQELPWLAAAIATHHKGWQELAGPGRPFFPEAFRTGVSVYSKLHHLAAGLLDSDADLLFQFVADAPSFFARAGWPEFPEYTLLGSPAMDVSASIQRALEFLDGFMGRFNSTARADIKAAINTRGWLLSADHLASYGYRELTSSVTDLDPLCAALRDRRSINQLNEHQVAMTRQVGSAVLVAPTGSGKTEAALLWATAQPKPGRLHFVLPYQASMNSMQDRLVDTLFPASEEAWNDSVALVHGRAMRRLYEKLLDRDYSGADAARIAKDKHNLARLNAAPILVSSPFALIRLLFATKGAEGLLAPFERARLVLDEIHAYDTQVTALTLAVLRFLEAELDTRTLLMSATLPSHLLSAIRSVLPSIDLVPAGADVLERPPRHRLWVLPCSSQSANAVAAICSAAERGSVLVVVNQVKRARALRHLLCECGADVTLLHSRFTYSDRAQKERRLAPCPGRILIGTQAVEVSLDLDFDTCFSELAPVESIIQRFGRCNRRERPGSASRCASVYLFGEFPASESASHLPYDEDHLGMVKKTLIDFISDSSSVLLGGDSVQALVNKSYPPSLADDLRENVLRRQQSVTDDLLSGIRPFGLASLDETRSMEADWEQLFDGEEVLPKQLVDKARAESSWLGRSRFLVPISRFQVARLVHEGRWQFDPELGVPVVLAAYDDDSGLDLEGARSTIT